MAGKLRASFRAMPRRQTGLTPQPESRSFRGGFPGYTASCKTDRTAEGSLPLILN